MLRLAGVVLTVAAAASLALADLTPPDPPPVPSAYQSGAVINGDFQTGDFAGWSQSWWGLNSAEIVDLGGNCVARLHCQGEWRLWHDPFMPGGMERWEYESGTAIISQSMYVPQDATQLTLVYTMRSEAVSDPWDPWGPQVSPYPSIYVALGSYTGQSAYWVYDWTTMTVPIAEADRGKTLLLNISCTEGGGGYYDPYGGYYPPPSAYAVGEFYFDFIGMDGTVPAQHNSYLLNSGGGAWETAENWSPQLVPDNSLSDIFSVYVPVLGAPVTVSSARTVRTITQNGQMAVRPGGALTVNEKAWVNAPLTIEPGGLLTGKSDVTVTDATMDIHPDGAVGQDLALDVKGTLQVRGQYGHGALNIRDGLVKAQYLKVGENGRLDVSAGARVSAYSVDIQAGGEATIGGGTVGPISGSCSLYNYGTLTVSGGAFLDAYVVNGGTITVTGGDVRVRSLTGDYWPDAATLNVNSATLRVDGDLSMPRMNVTPDSLLQVGSLHQYGPDDLRRARVLFDAPGSCGLYGGSVDRGAWDFGIIHNRAIGDLRVGAGETLGFHGVMYVSSLKVGAGATVNLNGGKIYYVDSYANDGTVTNGTVVHAKSRGPWVPDLQHQTFTATATAGWNTTGAVDGPASAEYMCWGPDPWMAPAITRANADMVTVDGITIVTTWLGADSGGGYSYEEPSASASVSALLDLLPNDSRPAGSMVDVLVSISLWHDNYYGGPFYWSCSLSQGGTYLDLGSHDPGGTGPASLKLQVGEPISLYVTLSDQASYGGYFYDEMQVVIAPVPEPTSLGLLALGGLALMRRRRK